MPTSLQKLRHHFDWPLFVLIALILAVGLLNLNSATASTRMTLFRQQSLWIAIGLVAFTVTAMIDYRVLYRLSYWFYGVGVGLLAVVLVMGTSINQSQRWLRVGGIALQPSELIKVLVILALAKHLHDERLFEGRGNWRRVVPFLLAALPAVLVLEQPDLGTALLIFLIFLSVMLLVKLRPRAIVALAVIAAVSLPLIWTYVLHGYQKRRIEIFLDPGSDPSGAGWQARQSLFAIGSGGVWGKGYLEGTQNQLHFLPERWTDFPFAVWAEEWGFVGVVLLLALYLMLILWTIKVASQARDFFGTVVSLGVASLLFWHTLISVGMVTGLAPVVGVTLPLFSYGGSSLVTMMMAVGLVMNVSVRKSAY